MSHSRSEQEHSGEQSGFTLMELLVVIAIILLITLIAIPNLPGMRIEANENSAIASIRSIYKAEVQYETTYPTAGFACSLAQLGGKAGSGAPSPAEAQVLETELARGRKSGYLFQVSSCSRSPGKDGGQLTSFLVTAIPQTLGKTGHRGFCIDQQGDAKADPAGGTKCTQSLQ